MHILAMKEKNWLLSGLAEIYLKKKKAVKIVPKEWKSITFVVAKSLHVVVAANSNLKVQNVLINDFILS